MYNDLVSYYQGYQRERILGQLGTSSGQLGAGGDSGAQAGVSGIRSGTDGHITSGLGTHMDFFSPICKRGILLHGENVFPMFI